MAGDEELLSVDDANVFAAALSDTPPAEPEQQSEEPKPEGDRPRDEQGRFLPKAADAETPAQPQAVEPTKAEPVAADKPPPDEAIPSWRLREETQRRREAEERLATASAQLQLFLNQARQQQQRQPEPLPDLIEQPEAYARAIEQRLTQQFEQRDIARSLHRADRQYGEEFRQAYEAFNSPQYANDEHLLQRVRNSYDQGEAILAWHREQTALREIGPDPSAYRQKLRSELMQDAEFRKEFMASMRAEATTKPSSVTSLPNLARAPGSASGPRDDWPTTDAEIFADVTRRRA